MKKLIVILGLAVFAAILQAACEGPAGPQGIQGIQGEKGEAGKKGDKGESGADGLSIVWQGEHETAPYPAYENWAYYNSADKKAYIYDGESWQVLIRDGEAGPQGPKGETGEKGDSLYLVIFNASGGAFSDGNETKKVSAEGNGPIARPEEPYLGWGGFLGWYTRPEGGSLFDFTTPVNAAITLYAHWLFDKNLLADWLMNQDGGDGEDAPLRLKVNIHLDNWQDLLEAIEAAQKYIDLDLSLCNMSGTVFNPGGGNAGKDKIVSIILPDKATEIAAGSSAAGTFADFANLRSFNAVNLAKIGAYAFYKCANLAITELPDGITSIGSDAFNGCTNLALTELPPGLTIINSRSFQGCEKLALTALPEGITTINTFAFSGCTNLALTELPPALKTTQTNIFNGCSSLTEITVYEKITNIGSSAFSGCVSLTLFICMAETPPKLGSNVFSKTSGLVIKVPAANIEAYKTSWSTVADKIYPID